MFPTTFRLALVALPLMALLAACNSEEQKAATAPESAPQEEARPANVPILEGYKYYVAGPVMKKDAYGRFRILDFKGEVPQPPSRGLIFGVKRDGDRFEYKVWANGRLVGAHRGIIRDKLYWPEYREGYRDEKLVAREYVTNDDVAKVMRVKVEDVDPANGEVIRTSEMAQDYTPPPIPEDSFDEEGGTPDKNVVAPPGPAAPAPPGKPGAPAVAAPATPAKSAEPPSPAPTAPARPSAPAPTPAMPAPPAGH